EEQMAASLKEKEALLKEIHHRVKNNLQVVSSIFSLQCRRTSDPELLKVLKESQNRILSIAVLHETLYRTDDLSAIPADEYFRQILSHLRSSYGINSHPEVQVDTSGIELEIDQAIPCGLLINELVTNSFKYAFPTRQAQLQGRIQIELSALDHDRLRLVIADNGHGLPEHVSLESSATLGLRLVRTLATQLDADIKLQNEHGVRVEIDFAPA
ncbi:MAG: sensor histidine kinase, partial [Bdellovibrionales bacterium]|nr:sensor histidine kinase [Bdellovibrionales bacterium]